MALRHERCGRETRQGCARCRQSLTIFFAPHGVTTPTLLAQLDEERLHGLLIAEEGDQLAVSGICVLKVGVFIHPGG